MQLAQVYICNMLEQEPYGEVFLIDKPLEWTSFDVVNKIRFKIKHNLKVKKIKVLLLIGLMTLGTLAKAQSVQAADEG